MTWPFSVRLVHRHATPPPYSEQMRSASVRTFHADEFSPADLVDAKGDQTVSLCLPARNEESTVGLIVDEIRHALIDSIPLVDEILVVDDHSSDARRRSPAPPARASSMPPRCSPATARATARARRCGSRSTRPAATIVGWVDADIVELQRQVRRRSARPPAARSVRRLRQGVLRATRVHGHRRRTGHRAGRPAAAVDVLPRAHLGVPTARRRVRRTPRGARAAAVRRRLRRRRRPPDRHRPTSAGSSASPRSTSASGTTATARSPSWGRSPTR